MKLKEAIKSVQPGQTFTGFYEGETVLITHDGDEIFVTYKLQQISIGSFRTSLAKEVTVKHDDGEDVVTIAYPSDEIVFA